MTYIPPTWHNNYDNSHLLEVAEDSTVKPKPEYQTYADEVNLELERSGSDDHLVWSDVLASFVVRSVTL
jgi:hypothetical protein